MSSSSFLSTYLITATAAPCDKGEHANPL